MRRGRDGVEVALEDDRQRGAGERRAADDHLVEQDADRVDVGGRLDEVAADLLGRHVLCRTDQARLAHGVLEEAGQAEVDHLGEVVALAQPVDDDVLGGEVAVDDAARVRLGQRGQDLAADRRDARDGERVLLDQRRQRASAQVLHHQEGNPVTGDTEIVDGHRVRVVDPAGGHRLGAEPLEARGDEIAAQQLHRDRATEADLLGLIHNAHASAAEKRDQTVLVGQRGPGQLKQQFPRSGHLS